MQEEHSKQIQLKQKEIEKLQTTKQLDKLEKHRRQLSIEMAQVRTEKNTFEKKLEDVRKQN